MLFKRNPRMPTAEEALPGRAESMPVAPAHFVNGQPLKSDFEGLECAFFGLGCFWGAERMFWQEPGVVTSAVGYMAGLTPNPTYEEVCSGRTGHNEAVMVVFDPAKTSFARMLEIFWSGHDPTQGMQQGNDVGTQYRSGIYTTNAQQLALAEASRAVFQKELDARAYGAITTEIQSAPEFYYAEDYHQQYLAKNPSGYCGLGGTGLELPAGWAA